MEIPGGGRGALGKFPLRQRCWGHFSAGNKGLISTELPLLAVGWDDMRWDLGSMISEVFSAQRNGMGWRGGLWRSRSVCG